MIPTFVVVGAERSGTTSLHRYLRQHPAIFMPAAKSLAHLVNHPAKRSLLQGPNITYGTACRSRDEYLEALAGAAEADVVGELAHIYLYAPESPGLIRQTLGSPKIIAVIRNPIDRAYAKFALNSNFGIEPLATFDEALEVEDSRVRAGWDPVYHYTRRGFYGEQLARYFGLFPASDVRVYKFEDFFRDPAASMADLYGFVGADPAFVPDVSNKYTPAGDPRAPEFVAKPNDGPPKPKPVEPATRTRLTDLYAADVREAERLTGLDLSDWFG